MADRVSFTLGAARRIVDATRRVEREFRIGPRRDRRTVGDTPGFWVQLVAADPVRDGWYSWKKVNPNGSGGFDIVAGVESGAASFTAHEANDTTGLEGTYQLVDYAGPDATGTKGTYTFTAAGGDSAGGAIRYVVTATNTTEPRRVEAIPYGGGDVVYVRQVIGHGIGDDIYAFKPANGTDLAGVEWREAGPDGLDFPCNLEQIGGTGTLASPYTYHVKIGAFYLTASPVAALRSGAGGAGADAWAPVLARAAAPAKFGRARFAFGGVVELVQAFETYSPVVTVTLDYAGSIPPIASDGTGGASPASVTYTVKDVETGATLGTGATPPRPFGSAFNIKTAATYGIGTFNVSGAFTLLAACNEEYAAVSGCA